MPRLLIATNNPGKVREFRELLEGCGWQIVAPADIGLVLDVDETGVSYSENARIKAEAFSGASGVAERADDSGLVVDAVEGEPGPLHHVRGWDGTNDRERIQKLHEALKDVPAAERTGRYRAGVVLYLPGGRVYEAE